jgi:hypothetical protein
MSGIFGDGVVTVNRYASDKAESTGRNLMGSKSKSCRAPPQKNLVQESDQCQRYRQNVGVLHTSFQHLVLVRPLARHQRGPITLQLLLLPATICTLVGPAIISSVAIYSLFTHVPHQGTSAMVSFPSLHFIVQSSSSYLFSIFCRCSFLSIIVVLFWGERSFTGRNRFPSTKMRALSRDYQNAIARRKDAP